MYSVLWLLSVAILWYKRTTSLLKLYLSIRMYTLCREKVQHATYLTARSAREEILEIVTSFW